MQEIGADRFLLHLDGHWQAKSEFIVDEAEINGKTSRSRGEIEPCGLSRVGRRQMVAMIIRER